jgi:hypothetical protein
MLKSAQRALFNYHPLLWREYALFYPENIAYVGLAATPPNPHKTSYGIGSYQKVDGRK